MSERTPILVKQRFGIYSKSICADLSIETNELLKGLKNETFGHNFLPGWVSYKDKTLYCTLTLCAHFLYIVVVNKYIFGNKFSFQKHIQNLKSLKRKKEFQKLHFNSS